MTLNDYELWYHTHKNRITLIILKEVVKLKIQGNEYKSHHLCSHCIFIIFISDRR
jgi:hypothetical protein